MVVKAKSHEGSEQLFIFHRGPRVCESSTSVVLYSYSTTPTTTAIVGLAHQKLCTMLDGVDMLV